MQTIDQRDLHARRQSSRILHICVYVGCVLICAVILNLVVCASKAVNKQLQFKHFHKDLTKGPHTMKWVFSKDFGVDEGEDQAAIKHIILAGAHESGEAGECSADLGDVNACTECPTGTYADAKGLGECLPCPFGTYNGKKGATEPFGTAENSCKVCKVGTFAIPGSESCRCVRPARSYACARTRARGRSHVHARVHVDVRKRMMPPALSASTDPPKLIC